MNDPVHTSHMIEALLFAAGEPLAKARLKAILNTSDETLHSALTALDARLTGGIRLLVTDTTVGLATAPEASDVVTQLLGDPGEKDIGQAGLEVLSIVLYQGPSTKATIDYIRGVNSSSTVRTLTYRGLIERTRSQNDAREVVYQPTAELLAHLGISKAEQMPKLDEIRSELLSFITRTTQNADA